MNSNNEIKLGDFGIAKILNSQTEFANTVIGTPYYLSPELCEDKPYNSKSDVWALGCVLYEVTTLKHAFNGQNLPALVLKILKGKYPPIPEQYSDNLKRLIARTLSKSPELRPSMEEILQLPFLQKYVQTNASHITPRNVSTPPLVATSATDSTPPPPSSAPSHSKKKTPIPKRAPNSSDKDDPDWLGDKQKELENMYNALHPSRRNPIDADTREKVSLELADRKEGQSERAKRRKEELRNKLKEERKSPNDLGEMRRAPSVEHKAPSPSPSPPPQVQQSVQAQKQRPPRAQQQPVQQSVQVQKPPVQRQQPPPQQQIQQPQKQQPIAKPPSPSPVIEEQQIKDQKNKDRQQYFDKLTGADAKDKKKQFLAQKKLEKEQAKELEKQKKREHDLKMKAIKQRTPVMRVNKSVDDIQVEPEKEEPKPYVSAVLEKSVEQEQKEKEQKEKAKQAAEKRDSERKNFLQFIKQQKQKTNQESSEVVIAEGKKKTYSEVLSSSLPRNIPAEIIQEPKHEPVVEPSPKKLEKKSSWITAMKKGKKETSSEENEVQIFAKEPPPKRPAPEPPKEEPKPAPTPVEPVKISPRERAKEPAKVSPREPVTKVSPREEPPKEVKQPTKISPREVPKPVVRQPSFKKKTPEPKEWDFSTEPESPVIEVQPPTQKLQAEDLRLSNDHVLDSVLTTTKKTEEQTAKEKLSVRIEYLRQYCEKRFGEELFMKVYRFLRQVSDDDDDMETHEKLQQVLGSKFASHYPYVQKIQHLIFCEDSFYG
jgi:NIMA (never in mitosis gene a)-related kinase